MMAHAALLDRPEHRVVPEDTAHAAQAMQAIATECDTLCFNVGAELCQAVPALNELTQHLTELASALCGEEVAGACATLRGLADEVIQVMQSLVAEASGLKALSSDGRRLSKLIEVVAEDIRFLSAMITNVKIEACALDSNGQGLRAFAEDLAKLAANANATISTCQWTHDALLSRIDRAMRLQAEFEATRQADLGTIARDLDNSIEALETRRSSVSAAASDIARMTQDIGEQVGQSVLALQIGDNIRQRVEHVGAALQSVSGDDGEALFETAEDTACALIQIRRLQSLQLAAAASDLDTEMRGVESNLARIHLAATDLREQSRRIVASDAHASGSFLGDLESRLRQVCAVIEDYRTSRRKIDEVIAAVATTFIELERLGNKVSAMVGDMTIIGMNAIVRSYGLGQRGAGLSVIAQHLRTQAMKVSDGIELLAPAIVRSREASATFAETPAGPAQDRITELEDGLTRVLAVFDRIGGIIDETGRKLDTNIDELDRVLPKALRDLAAARDIDGKLAGEIDALEAQVAGVSARDGCQPVLGIIDRLLAPLYTMAAERKVHADFIAQT